MTILKGKADLAHVQSTMALVTGDFFMEEWPIQGQLTSEEGAKWPNHEADMVELSKYYKNVVFHLYVEGEEHGDVADKYFLNGKKQICKGFLAIPQFDPKRWE